MPIWKFHKFFNLVGNNNILESLIEDKIIASQISLLFDKTYNMVNKKW